MDVTISFPANGAQPAAGPFSFQNVTGLRIAAIYTQGTGIGDGFSLSFLAARERAAPNPPNSLEANDTDISQYRGQEATVAVSYAGVLVYAFNGITFEQIHTSENIQGNLRRRIGLFGFRYSDGNGLANTNQRGGATAVNLNWMDGGVVAPPVATGVFSIVIPAAVAAAATAAQNGAPTVVNLNAGKALASASLMKDANPAGGTSAGVLSLTSHRDGTNEWLNSLLIQNCGQAAAVGGGGAPQANGGLTLTVNARTWTNTDLTDATVQGYLVEEVWGLVQASGSTIGQPSRSTFWEWTANNKVVATRGECHFRIQ